MTGTTVCVPLNPDGTIHDVLGQSPVVATCRVHDGQVTDWHEHEVDWGRTYGVDVRGVHHPRLVRFVQDNNVDVVVADDVCASIQTVLTSMGVEVRTGHTGPARDAVVDADRAVI